MVGSAGSLVEPLDLLSRLASGRSERLRHVHRVPARTAQPHPWPQWTHPDLVAALQRSGVVAPWTHQVAAAAAAWAGESVVLATGTASGKSLAFNLPVLSAVLDGLAAPTGRGATALYLAPTKALAHDQFARIDALELPGLRAATLDGDTDPQGRRWAREHAAYLLTNPDLLHHSLLPSHQRWAPFWRALRYVVIDECHAYRGVFGAHLALVLHRLRRVAAHYRADPTLIFASATVADPGGHAGALAGMPVRAITEDGSPRAGTRIGLWECPPGRSAVTETAMLLAESVAAGVQTVAFARSRAGAELIAKLARQAVGGPAERIAAYRAGMLPEERRAIEAGLRSGRIRGVAATTALELGVDLHGLDAVLIAGWPGTVGSFWQQVGRAGRADREAGAVLIGADNPLDRYLLEHPEAIFGGPLEAAAVDRTNPSLLRAHLPCAAAELPLLDEEFGDPLAAAPGSTRRTRRPARPRWADAQQTPPVRVALDRLVGEQVLRRRGGGWYWTAPHRPSDLVSLRGIGPTVAVVERRSGRVLGHVEAAQADATVHIGAVYLHQGEPFVVTGMDEEAGAVLVVAGDPGWTTQPRSVATFTLGQADRVRSLGTTRVALGPVQVHRQVVSFLRRAPDDTVLGEHKLDLPVRTLSTRGLWWVLDPAELAHLPAAGIPGALHALEHLLVGMLPLVVSTDPRDLGGAHAAAHPDTGGPTVLIHDALPDGAGLVERGYAALDRWLTGATAVVDRCRCADGCPQCVQSGGCGSGNEPLNKSAAAAVLHRAVAPPRSRHR